MESKVHWLKNELIRDLQEMLRDLDEMLKVKGQHDDQSSIANIGAAKKSAGSRKHRFGISWQNIGKHREKIDKLKK